MEARGVGGQELATATSWPSHKPGLDALRAESTPVFINFDAAWCITCKVNERVAITAPVLARLNERGIVYMKGDWTRRNPEITAILRRHRRAGVPLYLLYPSDSAAPAEVLPQILTESLMLNKINALQVKQTALLELETPH